MGEQTYRLVFHGKVADGQDQAIVKGRLAKMFRLERGAIDTVFSGSPVIVKNKLPLTVAEQYKQKFEQSGALCELEKEDTGPVADANKVPAAAPAKTDGGIEPLPLGNQLNRTAASRLSEDLTAADLAGLAAADRPKGGNLPFAKIIGFVAGACVYGVVRAIAPTLGLGGTVGGFDVAEIAGLVAGVAAWNRCSAWLETLDYAYRRYVFLAIFVSAAGLIYASLKPSSLKPSQPEAKAVKSITQAKLNNLQLAMDAIQGAVIIQNVPFPQTPEEMLAFIHANGPLFPGPFRMAGPQLFKDEWGNAIRYELDGGLKYTFRSAGPDKTFGTSDDLVVTSEQRPPSPLFKNN